MPNPKMGTVTKDVAAAVKVKKDISKTRVVLFNSMVVYFPDSEDKDIHTYLHK